MKSLAEKARNRRFEVFARMVPRGATILDVGGEYAYWTAHRPLHAKIVLLNTFVPTHRLPPDFSAVVGDARDLSRYLDRSFDFVFSNSVINLVGGFADQLRMASEIRRVGKRYFLQAPNHGFVVDWRTLVPGFHWLPPLAQAWCLRRVPVGTYRRAPDDSTAWARVTRVRDLRRRDLDTLFPGGTVTTERAFGLVKSFMVHGGAAPSDRHNVADRVTA